VDRVEHSRFGAGVRDDIGVAQREQALVDDAQASAFGVLAELEAGDVARDGAHRALGARALVDGPGAFGLARLRLDGPGAEHGGAGLAGPACGHLLWVLVLGPGEPVGELVVERLRELAGGVCSGVDAVGA